MNLLCMSGEFFKSEEVNNLDCFITESEVILPNSFDAGLLGDVTDEVFT